MLVILYERAGRVHIGEQAVEEVLKRVQYGEIVSYMGNDSGEWFKTYAVGHGVKGVQVGKWEGIAGVAIWIETEDGYDVDGNPIKGGEGDE